MAFNGNSSDQKTVKTFELYTGIGRAKVIAINPTLAELHSLGFTYITNEPEYMTTGDDGGKKFRVQFYLQSTKIPDLKTSITFFLENKDRVSQAGDKQEYINNFGKGTWATSLEEAINKENPKNGKKMFDSKGARVAKVGEVGLMDFIINWVNIRPTDEATFENFQALLNGNLSELRATFNQFKDNEVKVMFTVKESNGKHYQSINSNVFDRAFKNDSDIRTFEWWVTGQTKNGREISDAWSYELKVYVPKPVESDTNNSGYDSPATQEVVF